MKIGRWPRAWRSHEVCRETIGSEEPVVLTAGRPRPGPGRVDPTRPWPTSGGQFLRPELAAVDNHDLPRSLVAEVADRLFRHLARSDHQRRLVVEGLEDLPSEISHGHAGNAHAPLVDGCLDGNPPGDLDRRLEDGMGQRARPLLVRGGLISLLDLRENLRFADHHAVEAGGDGEQVANGVGVFVAEQMLRDLLRNDPVYGQESPFLFSVQFSRAFRGGIQFRPIAGRAGRSASGNSATGQARRITAGR